MLIAIVGNGVHDKIHGKQGSAVTANGNAFTSKVTTAVLRTYGTRTNEARRRFLLDGKAIYN